MSLYLILGWKINITSLKVTLIPGFPENSANVHCKAIWAQRKGASAYFHLHEEYFPQTLASHHL